MGVWLGVDLGNARVGLALSDPSAQLAFPLQNIKVFGDSFVALNPVIDLIEEQHVEAVVIGDPLTLAGKVGAAARKAKRWAKQLTLRLERLELPVPRIIFQDERLTTVTAHQQLRSAGYSQRTDRQMVDQQAAVIILQAALDAYNYPEKNPIPPHDFLDPMPTFEEIALSDDDIPDVLKKYFQ